jgi:Na+/melibiose symporter-like transporter
VSKKSDAFVKGGCGCLIAFILVGLLVVLFGGRMHLDIGGAIILFGIGGVVGLVFLAVYAKGKRDRSDDE